MIAAWRTERQRRTPVPEDQPPPAWQHVAGRGHRRWLPLAGLLLALGSVFVGLGDRDHFYGAFVHSQMSAKNMALAANLSLTRGVTFLQVTRRDDGALRQQLYNRFPLGGFVLLRLAIAPFADDLSAQIVAARALMLMFFCAAAILAYLAVVRLFRDRWVALGAALFAFSSQHMLDYNDIVTTEISVDLFAVLLVFHGTVVFVQAGRFGQLLAKTAAALLLGWHVYALLLPFILIGLGIELASVWRGATGVRGRLWAMCATALRSRHTRLGVLALLFGTALLAGNFAQEYALYQGERAFLDVPSARSMLRRIGANPAFNADRAEMRAWPRFLAWQFHRVGGMALPHLVPAPRGDLGDIAHEGPGRPTLAWVGVAACVACVVAVCVLPGRRLLVPLVLVGFCWALPLRSHTAIAAHDYETVFYVGVPLVLGALLLLGARALAERWRAGLGRRAAAGLGTLAVPGFVVSSLAMAASGPDAHAAQTQRALMAEFEVIRPATRGRDVLVAAHRQALDRLFKVQSAFHYYMAGSVLIYEDARPPRAAALGADFLLATRRVATGALSTPGNRFVFLYDSPVAFADIVAARQRNYDAIAAHPPAARAVWQLHVYEDAATGAPMLAYLKPSCREDDISGRFLLHLFPERRHALAPRRRHAGFDVIAFGFGEYGTVIGEQCMINVPLPDYTVARVWTRYEPAHDRSDGWETAFRMDLGALMQAYESVRSAPALIRSTFHVYLRDGRLIYTKTPCDADAVQARFFLHVTPRSVRDLPPRQRRLGFDNLDFDFRERGAMLPGKCVAAVHLPDHPVTRVRTGQLRPEGGVAWVVEANVE